MSTNPSRKTPAELLDLELAVAVSTFTAESLADVTNEDRGWRVASKSRDKRDYSIWTATDLQQARDRSRDLLRRNPFAIGAAKNRVNYVIDLGFQYGVQPMPGVDPAADVVKRTGEFVTAFVEYNALSEVESEALHRGDRDGEFLLRLFPNDGEIPEVRFVESDVLADPDEQTQGKLPSGSVSRLGVITPAKDAGQVLGYWIDGEFVPEGEIVHGKFNADSACPRGVPLFDPIDDTLRDCQDLWRSMNATAKARAKIAILIKMKQLNAQTEAGMASRLLEGTQTDARGDTKAVNVEQVPFGTVWRYNGQTTDSIDFPNANLGASDSVQVLTAGLQSCGVAVTMPAWMFTGEASEKYANAFVGEAPALKGFRRHQRRFVQLFGEGRLAQRASLVWRAVRVAVESKLLPPEALTACKVTCTPPTLEVRDAGAEASKNSTYNGMGVLSVQTIQEQLSLDPKKEADRITKERAAGIGAAFAYKATQADLTAGGMAPGGALPPTGPKA
ncbi:hypothetical protein BH11PLA2_BH11PLA2_32750 [soil metagenome]